MSNLDQLRRTLNHKKLQREIAEEQGDTEAVAELDEIIEETYRMIEDERSKDDIETKIYNAKVNAVMERARELALELNEERNWNDTQTLDFMISFSKIIEVHGIATAIAEMKKWELRSQIIDLEEWRARFSLNRRGQ